MGRRRFAARILELVADRDALGAVMGPMLRVRAALIAEIATLHEQVLDIVRDDPVCRLMMTVPGVGPVVALTFRATVDAPARFTRSKTVGAHFGLTPRRFQSGEIDRHGRISMCGDAMMRSALYEAANVLLTRVSRWSWLKAWAVAVAKRRGQRKATVALARRLGGSSGLRRATGATVRSHPAPQGARRHQLPLGREGRAGGGMNRRTEVITEV